MFGMNDVGLSIVKGGSLAVPQNEMDKRIDKGLADVDSLVDRL